MLVSAAWPGGEDERQRASLPVADEVILRRQSATRAADRVIGWLITELLAILQSPRDPRKGRSVLVHAHDRGVDRDSVLTFADQNTAVLAVRSGRADAAFSQQIPLTYYVSQDSNFELAGVNQANGFPNLYFGAYALKGQPVVNVLLGAFESLRTDGLYDAWLKKYGIESNHLDDFGINLATQSR